MITTPTQRIRPQLLLAGLLAVMTACSSTKNEGSKQRIRLSVGEIKEISLPSRGDGSTQLVGTSDNQEVVDVSRPELAPAVDTLNRDKSGPTVFQLKGITVGSANVIFSEKQPNQTGNGQIKKTYVVQVVAQ